AKGVLINIPDITSIPFFTTIDRNGATLTATEAAQLNSYYAGQGYNHINFRAGSGNAFVVADDNVGVRHIEEGEYLLLTIPTNDLKCNGLGTLHPIQSEYFLDKDEVAVIKENTLAFNTIIKAAATEHKLAYVDAYSFMRTLSSGM